jgi:hypothetical protein
MHSYLLRMDTDRQTDAMQMTSGEAMVVQEVSCGMRHFD